MKHLSCLIILPSALIQSSMRAPSRKPVQVAQMKCVGCLEETQSCRKEMDGDSKQLNICPTFLSPSFSPHFYSKSNNLKLQVHSSRVLHKATPPTSMPLVLTLLRKEWGNPVRLKDQLGLSSQNPLLLAQGCHM